VCDPAELANAKRVYLGDWLKQAKSVQEAVPRVQQQWELAKWEEDTICHVPNEAANILPGDVTSSLAEDLETVHEALPQIPQINVVTLCVSAATTSTTSARIYQVTEDARHSGDPHVHRWGATYSEQYEILQNQLGREQEVRSLLHNLNPKLGLEFDDAVSGYRAVLAGTSSQPEAGIALRNVIEHYKGKLMNLARQRPKEQKITWEDMSHRLVDNVGVARKRFQQQEKRWGDLQQRLSKLAKGHIQLDESELKGVFTEFLDHLYIVLSLLRGQGAKHRTLHG
jgi:hypothetical protein